MKTKMDFVYSDVKEPHRDRTKEILKTHPGVRNFIGRNPYTVFIVLFAVTSQFAIAYFLHDRPWWLLILIAYFVGAFFDHMLYVTMHECTHNLLFKKSSANKWVAIFGNTPSIVPSAISFQRYHLKHHSYQGIPELDGDLPYNWEARLVGNTAIGKAFWLLIYPVFQAFRPLRLKEIKPIDGWIIANWLVVLAANVLVCYFWGAKAFVYLVCSVFFSIGLHPLGARWIQEHFLTDGEQETHSYYGPLNVVNFNVGYHNEHHDFPSVPWNKLPEVKNIAPEYYETLAYHKSYTKLLFRFLFDRNISLFSRVVRKDRGGVPFTQEFKAPDEDLIESEKKG